MLFRETDALGSVCWPRMRDSADRVARLALSTFLFFFIPELRGADMTPGSTGNNRAGPSPWLPDDGRTRRVWANLTAFLQ